MKFLSVCSGIEAASVAWQPLGWKAWAFSEIDPFPCSLLSHHYPGTPNLGDMTKFKDWPDATLDLLCGGTPCQSFSVAGLRKGLDDPRGNLMLTFGAIAGKYRPRWLVWENVPGVLSSNGGRDFGTFLGMLGQLGYGFAYAVLDAQHFGIPQRRRRVFVVGCLGDWRAAAAVLFERHSLQGHPAPRRDTREVAPTIPSRSTGGGGLGTDFDCDGGLIRSYAIQAGALRTNPASGPDGVGVQEGITYTLEARAEVQCVLAMCLNAKGGAGRLDAESETLIPTNGGAFDVAHSLRGEGFDASEDGTGRGTPLVPVAFDCKGTEVQFTENGIHPTLRSMGHKNSHTNAGGHAAIAFALRGRDGGAMPEVEGNQVGALRAAVGGSSRSYIAETGVRRLTPRECERLQGFPDDYTLIPHRGKPAADGPRYKALGNSWAVPVVRWIGERIDAVDSVRGQYPETQPNPAPCAHLPAADSCSAAGASRSCVHSPARPVRCGNRPRTDG